MADDRTASASSSCGLAMQLSRPPISGASRISKPFAAVVACHRATPVLAQWFTAARIVACVMPSTSR